MPGTPRVLAASGRHDIAWLLSFLGAHAVPGIETWDGITYARSLRVHGRPHVLRVRAHPEGVETCSPPETDSAAVHLVGLSDDSAAAVEALGRDELIGPLVRARPGLHAPGSVDHAETLVRTVVGQQVSLASARAVSGRLVAAYGRPLPRRLRAPGGPTHLFPTPAELARADPASLPMTRARGRTVVAVATALAADPGAVGDDAALLAVPGVGPWTVDYTRLRVRRDPDVFLPTDLAVRRQLQRLGDSGGRTPDPTAWVPFRTTALLHLWAGYLDAAAGSG